MLRFLFGLLLGAIVGVGGTAYFFSLGGADYLLVSSLRVNRLEQDLQRTKQEREQVAKKLEETTTLVERMAERFNDLEGRFHALEGNLRKSSGEVEKAPAQEGSSSSLSPS